jgi:hypothetical protein
VSTDTLALGVRINFCAELANGHWLESLHGESGLMIDDYPDTEIVDCRSADVADLWRLFAERLAQRTSEVPALAYDIAGWAAARARWIDRWFEAWCARGLLQRARTDRYYEIGLKHAFRLSWRMTRAAGAYGRLQMARAKLQPQITPLSEQIRTYRRIREVAERDAARRRARRSDRTGRGGHVSRDRALRRHASARLP